MRPCILRRFRQIHRQLFDALDKSWILTNRSSQTNDIWIDQILDIEQALRQITVHALNRFLAKGIACCSLLINLTPIPSQTRPDFSITITNHVSCRSELRPVVEFFCWFDSCHVTKLSTQAMATTVKFPIDNHGPTNPCANDNTGCIFNLRMS